MIKRNKNMAKKKEDKKKQDQEEKKEDKDKEYKERIEELTNDLKRIQAEFENYKKRTEKEKQEYKQLALKQFMNSLLSIIDNFQLAFQNQDKHKEFVKGTELIYAQLFETLEEQGLRPIKAEGKKFDPYKHEALLTAESDKEPNTVLEELQRGYMLNEKILRPAKVKVSKPKSQGGK